MGWETPLGIALLLVGIGVYQGIQKISGGVTEFMKAYRDARGNSAADANRQTALQARLDELHDRLERIEERVDFNEALLRGEPDRDAVGPAEEEATQPRNRQWPADAGGNASRGSGATGEDETP